MSLLKRITNCVVAASLDTQLKFKVWQLRAESQVAAERSVSFRVMPFSHDTDEVLVEWLRQKLRRSPFWGRGHLTLARLAYRLHEIPLAYSSALAAMRLLRPRSIENTQALFLLGIVHLRSGRPDVAIEYFDQAMQQQCVGFSQSIFEEKAAALMQLEQYEQALVIFDRIGPEKLSVESQTAYEYARTKSRQGRI